MSTCSAPIPDETLVAYWVNDLAGSHEANRLEEHLFSCPTCTGRLERIASVGTALATLVRQGRVSGVVTRSLLNRAQHDGVRVRLFSLRPGETVPCACFPGDDLVVASLRADFTGVSSVCVSARGPDGSTVSEVAGVPVSGAEGEVLWALPAAVVRELPSMRLRVTLASADTAAEELASYVLEHSAAVTPV